jgi:hypothetical protein
MKLTNIIINHFTVTKQNMSRRLPKVFPPINAIRIYCPEERGLTNQLLQAAPHPEFAAEMELHVMLKAMQSPIRSRNGEKLPITLENYLGHRTRGWFATHPEISGVMFVKGEFYLASPDGFDPQIVEVAGQQMDAIPLYFQRVNRD